MNAAAIRKLIAEYDMAGLDLLEANLYNDMDKESNDMAELGDQLTNILGAKRVLEQSAKEGIEPKEALRTFFKDVRNIIG